MDPEGRTEKLQAPDDPSPSKSTGMEPPVFICTAIPATSPSLTDHQKHGGLPDSDSITSSLSMDDEERFGVSLKVLKTFRAYSLLLGLLVGNFIHMSSLGANYFLFQFDSLHEHFLAFSLLCSLFTSILGVYILHMVRSLIMRAWRERCIGTDRSDACAVGSRAILLYVECYFAVGAWFGISLSWTATDVFLGFHVPPTQVICSLLVTLVTSVAWCKLFSYLFGDLRSSSPPSQVVVNDQGSLHSDEGLAKPLLQRSSSTMSFEDETTDDSTSAFKTSSLILGLLVGFFIQYSSLGANFVMSKVIELGSDAQFKPMIHFRANRDVVLFSLVWSCFTSLVGILVLVCARRLIEEACNCLDTLPRNGRDELEDEDDTGRILLRLEAFFAVGALLGVNLSWIITNLILGLKVHIAHSLLTEALAILTIALCARKTAPSPLARVSSDLGCMEP